MVRNVLVIMVILVCTTSVVSYGVYNLKDNNKLGGISLFVLAFVTVVGSMYFLIREHLKKSYHKCIIFQR